MEWAPDGSKLVSGGGFGDCKIKLWSPSTGECLNTLEGHSAQINRVRFSLDGTMLVSCSGGYAQHDNSVLLWDMGTGKEIKKLEGHSEMVRACKFAPDGKTVVSASDDKTLKIWNVA